jgi:hypothetical protein
MSFSFKPEKRTAGTSDASTRFTALARSGRENQTFSVARSGEKVLPRVARVRSTTEIMAALQPA